MMGIGGGSFTVPTLSSFSKPIHKAVGSSALIGFFIAVPGEIIFTIGRSRTVSHFLKAANSKKNLSGYFKFLPRFETNC